MLRRLTSYAVIVLALGLISSGSALAAFTDVPAGHPNAGHIEILVIEYEVIKGYPDNTFRGENILNRYEFSKALSSALNYLEVSEKVNLKVSDPTDKTFPDVPKNHWAYGELMALVNEYQIIKGFPDGTFKGKELLNRIEVASALAKALGRVEAVAGKRVPIEPVKFEDVPRSHWGYNSVAKLVSAGIMQGTDVDTFSPKEAVSRYLLAEVLAKFIGKSKELLKKAEVGKVVGRPYSAKLKYGNVYQSASGTNNWTLIGLDLDWTMTDFWLFNNYYKVDIFGRKSELTLGLGLKNYTMVYMVPAGGQILSPQVGETRYDLDIDLDYPIYTQEDNRVRIGFVGGLKYMTLSSQVSSASLVGLNLGFSLDQRVTEKSRAKAKLSYTMPLSRGSNVTSILGRPNGMIDYGAEVDLKEFNIDYWAVGLDGEMFLEGDGNYTRFYNTAFVKYNF